MILDELGIDKHSDVLDSESTDLDFINAYMLSVGKLATRAEKAVEPIEKEVCQQVANTETYRDIIREDKDLEELVGAESDFDVSEALSRAIRYYAAWRGEGIELLPEGAELQSEAVGRVLRANIAHDKESLITSQNVTTPKRRCRTGQPPPYLITSQNVTTPKPIFDGVYDIAI